MICIHFVREHLQVFSRVKGIACLAPLHHEVLHVNSVGETAVGLAIVIAPHRCWWKNSLRHGNADGIRDADGNDSLGADAEPNGLHDVDVCEAA